MLRALIAKDLCRARRNPLPWVINLLIPLCLVAVFGVFFGKGSKDRDLGRIRFAFVDEDGSKLVEILRGGLNQGDAAKHLDPVFVAREPALKQLNDNQLSGVVIVPKEFTKHFLSGQPARLELIKNPAQSMQPAVLEELLGVLTAGMNAISRNLAEELLAVRGALDGNPHYREIAALALKFGDRIEAIEKLHGFPLAWYNFETRPGETKSRGPGFNLFGYLLSGMGGMFLLFLANTGMTDLHREIQQRTLERYATHHVSLLPFIAGKVVFVVVMLLICTLVLFGGGGLVFRISWQHPAQIAALAFGYAVFAAGLMAMLVALMPDQRRSDAFASMIGMGLAMAGGCMFPPQQFPRFMREHVTPLMPSAWFSDGVRTVEFAAGTTPWAVAVMKLLVVGLVLMAVAAVLFRARFAKGLKA